MSKLKKSALILSSILFSYTSYANNFDANLIKQAQKEGTISSLGMPDSWANWKGTWKDLKDKFALSHQDTDMSSAQEIAKFQAEGKYASADIGDIGIAFTKVAVAKGVTQPYKTSNWNEIPNWAKDKNGHWVLGYTGTIAFITNRNLVKNIPTSWSDIKNGSYQVSVGNVGSAAQANNAVLACAFATGGNETNIEPGLNLFKKLARQNRLATNTPSLANLEKGEIEVGILWDFNALSYRDKIDRERFSVTIPQDGSIISGYATIINKYAPHPNAAKLTREYILSDAGQINLANGYARPIRSNVILPPAIKAKLLPNSQYSHVYNIKDYAAWEKSAKRLAKLWQQEVLSLQN